jgi:DNA-binding transcriptional MerR regulator/methylmalonyl-CoA mutase cobalamin-binding subunit
MAEEQGHTMKVVARRTGLSPHVIRIWEKRYGAVTPSRTQTRRRLYTDSEIQRLVLLRRATLAGHSIRQIANLSLAQLRALVAEDEVAGAPPASGPRSPADVSTAPAYLAACMTAVQALDAIALENALMHARVALSHTAFLEALIVPMMQSIGDLWRDGSLRIMHEHLVSAIVRTLLGSLVTPASLPPTAPHMIVTTPAGQLHEIGALIVASIAGTEGWRVTYLGPNLPAEDIAAAVQQDPARAVGLSIIYPPDDPRLPQELARLRRYIGPDTPLFVGGRAAAGYDDMLQCVMAIRPKELAEFRAYLEALRTGPMLPQEA